MRGMIAFLAAALAFLPSQTAGAAGDPSVDVNHVQKVGAGKTVTAEVVPGKRTVVPARGGYALIVPKGTVKRPTKARVRVRPPINGVMPLMDAHIAGKWRGKVVVQLPFTGSKGQAALLTHYTTDGLRVTSGRNARVKRVNRQLVVRATLTSLSEVAASSTDCPSDPGLRDAIFVCRNQQDQPLTEWWEDTLPRLRGAQMLAIPVQDLACSTSTPGLQAPVVRTIVLFGCTVDYDASGWNVQVDLKSIARTDSWTFGPYLLSSGPPSTADSGADPWISRAVRGCPRCSVIRPGTSVSFRVPANRDLNVTMVVEKYALAADSAIGDMLQFVDPAFLAAAQASDDFSFGVQRCQLGVTSSGGPDRAECMADVLNTVLLDVIAGRVPELASMKEQATIARELLKDLDMGAYITALDRSRRDWPEGSDPYGSDQLVMGLVALHP